MKRFHLHVGVKDLEKSVQFYSTLFGQKPSKLKEGYAKWMLEDPRINFAISTLADAKGVDHLGIQVDSDDELSEITERLKKADLGVYDEGETTCCYAESKKAWVQDPSGGMGSLPNHGRCGSLQREGQVPQGPRFRRRVHLLRLGRIGQPLLWLVAHENPFHVRGQLGQKPACRRISAPAVSGCGDSECRLASRRTQSLRGQGHEGDRRRHLGSPLQVHGRSTRVVRRGTRLRDYPVR
jgi:hypothetical protein